MTTPHKTREDHQSNSAFVAFVNPFFIIRPDSEENFSTPLVEINRNTYNHGRLCRVVTALSIPHLSAMPLIVCADGAIAVPALPNIKSIEDVLDIFNRVMCSLSLGGHLCEAIDSRDVVTGSLHERRSIWPTNLGQSLSSHLRSTIRMRVASTIDTICLAEPKNVPVSEFVSTYERGRATLDKLPNLSPTLFLRGFTELRYGNTVDALSNLWVVVEQLTETLWVEKFFSSATNHPNVDISGRSRSLKEDTRTWSASVRQEILFQSGLLPETTFAKLYPARKARNDLVHQGRRPLESTVRTLLDGVLEMLELCSGIRQDSFRGLNTQERGHRQFHPMESYDTTDWSETATRLMTT